MDLFFYGIMILVNIKVFFIYLYNKSLYDVEIRYKKCL